MKPKIAFKPYARPFRRPLRTARGAWSVREGFLIRVVSGGRIGYGEVAPIPEFGSETLAQAAEFLRRLERDPALEVPAHLPCCGFALSAARVEPSKPRRDYPVSALLPAGAAAAEIAKAKLARGYQNLKWKIGVEPLPKELEVGRRLLECLPPGVRLRFDANASLNQDRLERWLDLLAAFPEQVDYLEQPLGCGEEAAMADYMDRSGVPIALDESLNAIEGGRFLKPGAWSGPLVIKAPLMGDVVALSGKLGPVSGQVVLSSVFETGIGLENALALADGLPEMSRPVGFDTVDAFDDALNPVKSAPRICANYNPEEVWNSM